MKDEILTSLNNSSKCQNPKRCNFLNLPLSPFDLSWQIDSFLKFVNFRNETILTRISNSSNFHFLDFCFLTSSLEIPMLILRKLSFCRGGSFLIYLSLLCFRSKARNAAIFPLLDVSTPNAKTVDDNKAGLGPAYAGYVMTNTFDWDFKLHSKYSRKEGTCNRKLKTMGCL